MVQKTLATKAEAVTASQRISAVVRMLLAGRSEKAEVLADTLGIARTTAYDKVRGNARWTVDEVDMMSEYFGLPIAAFYAGPSALIAGYASNPCLTQNGPTLDLTAEPVFELAQAS